MSVQVPLKQKISIVFLMVLLAPLWIPMTAFRIAWEFADLFRDEIGRRL